MTEAGEAEDCGHKRTIQSKVADQEKVVEYTICSDCDTIVDKRVLKNVSQEDLVPRVKRASERSERLATITQPKAAPVAVGAVAASHPGHAFGGKVVERVEVPPEAKKCVKQGGLLVACDTGAGKANLCHLSRWGSKSAFDTGPCGCLDCHAWPDER